MLNYSITHIPKYNLQNLYLHYFLSTFKIVNLFNFTILCLAICFYIIYILCAHEDPFYPEPE